MTLLAAATAAMAVVLLIPAPPRRPLPGCGSAGNRLSATRLLLAPLGGMAVALLAVAEGSVLALGLILLAAGAAAARLADRARRRRDAEGREAQVVEVSQVLAGELRAGRPPVAAVTRAAETWPELEPVAVAARLGADVPGALRRLSEAPGGHGLRQIAAAWQVSQGSGAGLAVAVTHVATSARQAQALRRLVTAELASAQATARMVAALPLLALLMGSGIGGDPWGFLLTTPLGLGCLALGLALALAGLAWIERIATGVGR